MQKRVEPASRIRGEVRVPGDKSISHRAVLLGAIAAGETLISNLSTSEDVQATVRCVRSLGVKAKDANGMLSIQGRAGVLQEPGDVLEAGNSGTTVRLLSGILAGQPFRSTLDGDASLRRRPMRRIIDPLSRMGALFHAREEQYLPLTVQGRRPLRAIDYQPPVASAQVKSSILLAGLFAEGRTRVREIRPTRDHTERMLPAFGASIERADTEVTVEGPTILRGTEVDVPGDPSSAAFLWAAAALLPDSRVTVRDVGMNPTRVSFLRVLKEMGARVQIEDEREQCGEPVASVTVEGTGELRAVAVNGDVVPLLIDELPLLAVVAAYAEGTTVVSDAEELRVKESDRIASIAQNLKALGAQIEERQDGWIIHGTPRLTGGRVESFGDHRIAMAMAVAGLRTRDGVEIDGAECVAVSFPNFFEVLDEARE